MSVLSDQVNEAQWERTIIELATWQGWRAYSIPDSRRATDRGFPDIALVHPTHGLAFIETKTNKGRVRPEQREWIDLLRKAGATAVIARPRDVEKVEQLLQGMEVEL